MDTELQKVNKGMNVEVEEEDFENAKSGPENVNAAHCADNKDLHIIDNKSVDKGLRNIEQDEVAIKGMPEKKDGVAIKGMHENLNSYFENDDNIYVFHNTDSDFQNIDEVNDGMLVEIINVKEKNINDKQCQTSDSDLEDKNHPGYVRQDSDVKEAVISGKEAMKQPHQCTVCDKTFKSSSLLWSHRFTHSTERPHKCSVCQREFKVKKALRSHVARHSSERQHDCKACGKAFKTAYELRLHMVTHNTWRPHPCKQCDKEFKSLKVLNSHMMSMHTTERPFKCKLCNRGFKRADCLGHHMISHSVDRPHQCNQCQKKFKSVKVLKEHMTVHDNRRYKCSTCEKDFKTSYYLKQHSMRHLQQTT